MESAARQVYIISGVQLGGAAPATTDVEDRGFRINTHVDQLVAFVRAIAAKPAPVGLIINGDTVDFLAERNAAPPYWVPFTSDPNLAAQKLEAIVSRDQAFFSALGDFLERGHSLTILLGNHDVELAFPLVRRKLETLIGVKGSHDYRFIYDGEALICGDALIEHGNRYDKMNVIDYDSMRRLCSLQSRRQPVPEQYDFTIPAGSNMVSWVINPIKEDYRFVDLLKPETGAVIPILLALEPGYRSLVSKALKFKVAAEQHRLAAAAMPSFGGDISSTSPSDMDFGSDISSFGAPSAPPRDAALQQELQKTMGAQAPAFLAHLNAGAVDDGSGIGSDISTMDTVQTTFGLVKLLLSRNSSAIENRLPDLLTAIRVLQTDRSFDQSVETDADTINSAKELARTGNFRYVIFGHTHLPKKVGMDKHLNCGTWVDLLKFPTEILAGSQDAAIAGVRDFVDDLAKGHLSPWIHYQPTFARLDFDAADCLIEADIHTWTGPDSV
jgi:UDP-2,3-diacylglucosamine pyrophosphatase LpxH